MSGTDALTVVAAYGLGSIPFAWIAARRASGIDLRRVGSGNVGATNLLRTSPTRTALLVLLLDTAKGCAAVWLAGWAGGGSATRALAGVAAVVGHVYPAWLRFEGGKGVATAFGAFAVLAPVAALMAIVAFTVLVWWSRFVSLGSLGGSLVLAAGAWGTSGDTSVPLAATVVAGLVCFRHRSNVRRLIAGTERRLGQRA
jgi:acyl phosphate:glycerol-3-phosphate acyltransferase